MIVDGKYVQPCVYDSGLWVTLMCPHSHIESKQIVIHDDKYKQYENKEGIFAFDLEEEQ